MEVIGIAETHVNASIDEKYIYIWFGHCMETTHRTAIAGSGRVGLLIGKELLEVFGVPLLDDSHEHNYVMDKINEYFK